MIAHGPRLASPPFLGYTEAMSKRKPKRDRGRAIYVRMPDWLYEIVQRKANEKIQPLAGYVRDLLLRDAQEEEEEKQP
jgi:hypothetical protein